MTAIRGVILAGGTGSRLHPLTKVTNKHLLPVGREPMLLHPLKKLVEANIREIMVITGPEHMGPIAALLGSGREYGCDVTLRVQDQPGGIAQALGLCQSFVGNERSCVVLGDNIFEASLYPLAQRFREQAAGARVLLKEVPDPERYGVATVEGKRIVRIVEKPKKPESAYAVVGIYFFDPSVFEIIKTLKPSQRGELEISDVTGAYVARKSLEFDVLDGWWTDAGTFDSWAHANALIQGTAG